MDEIIISQLQRQLSEPHYTLHARLTIATFKKENLVYTIDDKSPLNLYLDEIKKGEVHKILTPEVLSNIKVHQKCKITLFENDNEKYHNPLTLIFEFEFEY